MPYCVAVMGAQPLRYEMLATAMTLNQVIAVLSAGAACSAAVASQDVLP
jgi:hypothetical protein